MKYLETARRLKSAIERKNMKAVELSRMSGVSKASISQYTNGTHEPSNINAVKMGHVLDVDPMWLMGFDVPMISEGTMEYNKQTKSLNAIEVMKDALERTGYYDETFTDDEIKQIIKYASALLLMRD